MNNNEFLFWFIIGFVFSGIYIATFLWLVRLEARLNHTIRQAASIFDNHKEAIKEIQEIICKGPPDE